MAERAGNPGHAAFKISAMTSRTCARSGPGRSHMGGWKPGFRVTPRVRIDGRLSVPFAASKKRCEKYKKAYGKRLHCFYLQHTRLLSSFRLIWHSKIQSRSKRNFAYCFDRTGKYAIIAKGLASVNYQLSLLAKFPDFIPFSQKRGLRRFRRGS